jgi:large repetitive protein
LVTGESVDATEDVPLNIQASLLLANDSDIDNPLSDLKIVSAGSATHGSVTLNADGSLTFVPDLNYFGPASFVYTVSDGSGGFTMGTASLNIAPVNDAPVATGDAITLNEDTVAHFSITSLLANDSDVDNAHSDLAITGVSSAVGGTVQMTNGEIVFTPTLNFNGHASFQYTVSDGVGGSTQASVSIDFTPVNDAPVASDVNYDAKHNVAYTLTAAALLQQGLVDDVDTGSASVQLVSVTNGQHCTVSYNSTTEILTINPIAGYSGTATFDYVVQDPQGLQTTAHANINFVIANVAPFATDDSFVGNEDTSFVIAPNQLLANDWDQDNPRSDLSVTNVGNSHNGTVSIQNGNVIFTPNANFSGSADFQYQVSDGAGGSTWATAYVTVNPVNDAPVINSVSNSLDSYTVYTGGGEAGVQTSTGTRRIGDVNAFDVEADTLHFGIYAQPDHGYLTIDANTGHWIYSTTATTQTGSSFTNIAANTDTYSGGVDFSFYAEDSHGARTITQTIHAEYHGTASAGVAQSIAPIVIDLNNDGLDLVSASQSPFQYRADNAVDPVKYGWVGVSDGLLAFDSNHDGTISELNEISYTSYLEGAKTDLEGLAAFDSNHDGVLNASDDKWSDFGVFQDKNQNGICDAGEFISLANANVKQIDLQRTGSTEVVSGNIVFGDALVHRTDGTTTTAGDVAFVREGLQAPTDKALQDYLNGQEPLILDAAADSKELPASSIVTDNADVTHAAELAECARIRQMALYFNQVVATATCPAVSDTSSLGYVDLQQLHDSQHEAGLIDLKNSQSMFEVHS